MTLGFLAFALRDECDGQVCPAIESQTMKGTDDLFFWHERLAEEFFARAARGDPSDSHRDLLDFFTVAAERASELGGDTKAGDPATNDGFAAAAPTRAGKRVLH